MIIANKPANEGLRLTDLISYDILDTPNENDFDELVELAGQIFNCPISLITLVDDDRQWFKAKIGLEATETSRNIAFCSHAILQDDVMAVPDATQDERFFDNPLVTGDLNIRFYAGAPIVSTAGHKLGTFCIIDHQPKAITRDEERALSILSNQVTKLLELRKKNMLIRKRAEELIDLKTKVIGKVIALQETDKMDIAVKLHEDIAQKLASALIYLNMADEYKDETTTLLHTATGQVKEILADMRRLTYAITPYNINWVPAAALVEEFVEKVRDTFYFDVAIEVTRGINNATPEDALAAIRSIEQWLKILADKKSLGLVIIQLESGNPLTLKVTDDRPAMNYETFKKEAVDSLVYDRVNAQGGTVELSISRTGNVLRIALPLREGQQL